MRLKKRTKYIILITVGLLVSLFLYGRNIFENDKQQFLDIKILAVNGKISDAINKIDKREESIFPPINTAYNKWVKNFDSRFITKDEVIENTSGNKIINDISNIYCDYWRTELLKNDPKNSTDTVLYKNLTDYLLSNELTNLSKDSLSKTIRNRSLFRDIIKKEGFKTKFLYRNGFQDLLIWDKESTKKYEVTLPKDTIYTTVVFIESFHLNSYQDYATFGYSQVGGWAMKESATLYCNKKDYDLNSEKFKISYLKHESLHFTDLNKYPNLSITDLEYRAKIVELMHCTEKTIYARIAEFLNGANSSDRSHSHPYANYSIIKNLSKILFNSDFENNINKWKEISVEKINATSLKLLEESNAFLDKNLETDKVIN